MPRKKQPAPALETSAASAVAEVRRSVPNVAPRKTIDSGDHVVENPGAVEMSPTGDATDAFLHDEVVVVDGPRPSKEKLANLAFDNELVTVAVSEQNEQFPEPCVSTWVNGRHQLFPRGYEITCKRQFVEVLCRAKPVRYGNQEYVDNEGVRRFRYPKTIAPKYPFQMLRDDNPLGRPWLLKLLKQAN